MSVFATEFVALMDLCSNIIKASENSKLKTSNEVNPFLKYLNNYRQAFESTDIDIHQEYTHSLYRRFRRAILSGTKADWLIEGSAIIQFGEELKKPPQKICIRLSNIYSTSLKLREDVEKKLAGLPLGADSCPEIDYPEKMQLHLYRLFREVASKSDEPKLTELIKEMEKDLGIVENTQAAPEAGGMLGMLNNMQNMMKSMGINLPEDRIPNADDIGNILSKALGNPKAGDMAKQILGDVDLSNPQEALPTLAKNFQQSEIGKNVMAEIGPQIMEVVGKTELGPQLAAAAGKNVAANTQVEQAEDLPDDDD
jgi:hypothetical protein